MTTETDHLPGLHPDLPPPPSEVGVVGWIRHNMMASKTDIFLSIVAFYLIYLLVPPVISWVLLMPTGVAIPARPVPVAGHAGSLSASGLNNLCTVSIRRKKYGESTSRFYC